ncbi:hypothetical protein OJF2_42350 [Aquisphaera giovannonii]|uniref:Uncharacterized protein n=1 Tax=Aquisphaera giovannonii TaxID=406548 RepID=A0A5B9W6S6_9BACT|nr:hypothetical protein [Aquisphaera giovannonii]QEH35680.1 hypothetical protein OJF2_42350 [Aquisphaera giovannonii]
MYSGVRWIVGAAAFFVMTFAAQARSADQPDAPRDDVESRVGLADLPGYHAALTGRGGAEGPGPAPASFRDLWDHPEAWRGRRVEVRGRVARVFRQDAVGSFPAMAEVWLSTPAGDLICAHCPTRPEGGPPARIPQIGTPVRFDGRFMKIIRYEAGDQARLAPLVVGDRPPAAGGEPAGARPPGASGDPWPLSPSPAAWAAAAALGLAAAGALAWRHLRAPGAGARPAARHAPSGADAPPEFLDTERRDEPTSPGR